MITYSRSSGPGGQHVNTVNTKVDLRFKVAEAQWISEKVKSRLLNEVCLVRFEFFTVHNYEIIFL